MSDLGDWLETRRPEAPADLRARIAESVLAVDAAPGTPDAEASDPPSSSSDRRDDDRMGHADGDDGAVARARVDRLTRAARDRLDRARARPGRVRASAFELLVADALVTYACEAALEAEDPSAALEIIAEVGRRQ